MANGLVTVFGADGFLGHQVVRKLAKDGWRIRAAVRRPHVAQELRVMGNVGQIQLVQANIRNAPSVERALIGADAVINLVGISHQQGQQKFDAVHNIAVGILAKAAKDAGITNMVHMSSMRANENSKSKYSQSKAGGEKTLRAILPSADIVRPTLVVGEGGNFFSRFAGLSQLSMILPLIGGGKTRLQPVYVGDVAKAICSRINTGSAGSIYELGGPDIFTFKQLMEFTMKTVDRKRFLALVPWFAAKPLGFIGEMVSLFSLRLFRPFLTRDQVNMLKEDSVISGDYPGLEELGIKPETINAVIPDALETYKKYGQFHHLTAQ